MTPSPATVGVIMLLSGMVCSVAALYVQRHRHAAASNSLTAILVFSAIWAAFYGFELIAHDAALKEAMGNLKYIGVVLLPLSWLVFTLRFTGRGRLITRRTLALLAIEPVLVLVILALPATRELIRYYPEEPLEPFPIVSTGTLFWVNAVYLNILTTTATVLFLITLSRHTPQYRRQRSWLAVGYLLPWVPNVIHNLGIGQAEHLDLTPVALAISGPILVWGFFRSRLLDLAPVARRHVVEHMPDGVIVLDAYLRVVDHNPASSELLNIEKNDLIGVDVARLLPTLAGTLGDPAAIGPHRVSIPAAANTGAPGQPAVSRVLEIEVTTLEGFATITDRSAGYLLILRDATERLANEERLQRLAHHDPLTGLPNRKLFGDRLDQAIAHARRNSQSFALLFLDLDRFKVVNDTLGHEIGDLLLQQVAHRLQRCLREEDTIARIGGDEFIVLIHEINHENDASIVADKLITALDQPFIVEGHDLYVTASIGVARYPLNGTSPHQLVTRADSAMYLAKAQGKNRFHLADDRNLPRPDHLRFESDLRLALENDELDLDFQPCLTIGGSPDQPNLIISLEALARWHHPDRGTIPPDVFIPMAEEAGFMPALGLWVLERSCQQVGTWRDEWGLQVTVSVNVSAAQLGRHLLARHVGEAVAHSGLTAGQLVLEISERTVVAESDPVIAELETLRECGAHLSLDDFGTGHTSLGQLKRLRFDQLKIDQAFVRDITTDPDNAVIVAAMINLGHSLGMHVIAEGVERPDELDALRLLGCDAVQGFLLGRPLSTDPMTAMLVARAMA